MRDRFVLIVHTLELTQQFPKFFAFRVGGSLDIALESFDCPFYELIVHPPFTVAQMQWRGHLIDSLAGKVRQKHGKMGCNLGIFAQGLECRQPSYREVRTFGQLFRDLRELADPA